MAEDNSSISDSSTLQHGSHKVVPLHPEDYISLLRTLQTIAFPNGEPSRIPSPRPSPTRARQQQSQHPSRFHLSSSSSSSDFVNSTNGLSSPTQRQHSVRYPTVPNQKGPANENTENHENEHESNSKDTAAFLDAVSRLLVREPEQSVAASLSLTKPRARDNQLQAELFISTTNGCTRSLRGHAKKVWRCMQDVAHAASCESSRRTNSNKTTSSGGSVWSAKTAADYYLLEGITAHCSPKIMHEIGREWKRLKLLKDILRKKHKNSKRKRKATGGDAFFDPQAVGILKGETDDEKLYDVVRSLWKGLKECRSLYKQLRKKEGEYAPAMFSAIKTDADDLMDSLCRNLLASFSNFERGIGELDADLSFRMFDGTGVDNSRTLSKLDALGSALGFSVAEYVMDVFTYWADFQILDVYATYQRGRLIRMIDFDVTVLPSPPSSRQSMKKNTGTGIVRPAFLDIDAVQRILEDSNVAHLSVERTTEIVMTHEHKNRRRSSVIPNCRVHDVPNVLASVPSTAYPYVGLSYASNEVCVCCRMFMDAYNRAQDGNGSAKVFRTQDVEIDEEVSMAVNADWLYPSFVDLSMRQHVGMELVGLLRRKVQFYVFLVMQRERSLNNTQGSKGRPQTSRGGSVVAGRNGHRPTLSMSIPPQAQTRPPTSDMGGLRRSNTDVSMSSKKKLKDRFSWIPAMVRRSTT